MSFSYQAASSSLPIGHQASSSTSSVKPPSELYYPGKQSWKKRGEALLYSGKVAALMVAGGEGSRLGYPHPKGLFPLTCIKKKSLFQLFAEKLKAASHFYGYDLPLVIMLSEDSFHKVKNYFQQQQYFGLKPQQLSFLSQPSLPYSSLDGQLLYGKENKLLKGPNGNGAALELIQESGLLDSYLAQGIHTLSFFQVDNPLADPFDTELIGFHNLYGNDISLKAVLREDPEEKVGVIVEEKERLRVIEYFELPNEARYKKSEKGSYLFKAANTSMFCFSLPFIKQVMTDITLPYHPCKKKVKIWRGDIEAIKYEKFIFDVLTYTDPGKAKVLISPRHECFAPLKNAQGPDSIQSVQQALVNRDKQVYAQLFNSPLSHKEFELSPEFYYPSSSLIQAFKKLDPSNIKYLHGSLIQ